MQELGAARSRANTQCSSSLYDELETAELTGYESSDEDLEVDDKADVMISKFLGGIGEYSHSDIETYFRQADSDGSGYIDRDEFEDFIGMITSESVTDSISTRNNILGDDKTVTYMRNLLKNSYDGDNPFEDWGVFYCGGSNQVANILKEVTSKYGIDFAVEKFDW